MFPLWNVSGADDSEAESAGGEREAAGPAGALQKVFDTTQHAVGPGPAQRPRAQVTSSAGPPARSSLSGDTTPTTAGVETWQPSALQALDGASCRLSYLHFFSRHLCLI